MRRIFEGIGQLLKQPGVAQIQQRWGSGELASASCSFPLGICSSWNKRLRNWGGVAGERHGKERESSRALCHPTQMYSPPDPEEK